MRDLAEQFRRDMLADSADYTKHTKTNPSRYLQMIAEHGGIGTANILASDSKFHEGFTRAFEHGCLELTAEYLIVYGRDGIYQSLFPPETVAMAKKKLGKLEVKAPIVK